MRPDRSNPHRAAYPSDVSDRQWRAIADLLPPNRPDRPAGRRRATDLRDVIDGINYRWTTGCTWRMLPHDFPPWGTVYAYFRRWRRDDTLRRIRAVLLRRRSGKRASDGEME